MATGVLHGGILFVRKYLADRADNSTAAQEVIQLVDTLVKMVQWDTLMCEQKGGGSDLSYSAPRSVHATGIGFLQNTEGHCMDVLWPSSDGYYTFNEMMTTMWLSYNYGCDKTKNDPNVACNNTELETAWKAWQGRRPHPSYNYFGYPLLSDWSAYIVQIPYYTSHAFNSDPEYMKLF